MCKLIASTVDFRARKSRQNQQEEMDLETEHYDSKYGWIGGGAEGGREVTERTPESQHWESSGCSRRGASEWHLVGESFA